MHGLNGEDTGPQLDDDNAITQPWVRPWLSSSDLIADDNARSHCNLPAHEAEERLHAFLIARRDQGRTRAGRRRQSLGVPASVQPPRRTFNEPVFKLTRLLNVARPEPPPPAAEPPLAFFFDEPISPPPMRSMSSMLASIALVVVVFGSVFWVAHKCDSLTQATVSLEAQAF